MGGQFERIPESLWKGYSPWKIQRELNKRSAREHRRHLRLSSKRGQKPLLQYCPEGTPSRREGLHNRE